MKRICIIPGKNMRTGGPASFRRKLVSGLKARNIEVTHDLDHTHLDAVLVINGTRYMHKLWRCKKRKVRIFHRLGVPNLLHHRISFGWRVFLLAEIRNIMMRFIRSQLADHVIYQSHFVEKRWNKLYGEDNVGSSVIYNGVDLSTFNPKGERYSSKAEICIISVEGTQGADPYDITLKIGQELEKLGINIEILLFGKPYRDAQIRLSKQTFMKFFGSVPNTELPFFYRGSTFFLSTDIITAGCPNSVLESLGCGTPVLGYDAGPLPEMMEPNAGLCIDCKGDPFIGQHPENLKAMAKAALELFENRSRYSKGARNLSEKKYSVDSMVKAYFKVIFE
jgi:glycosyltransferase involved in cell wall biosynthesis